MPTNESTPSPYEHEITGGGAMSEQPNTCTCQLILDAGTSHTVDHDPGCPEIRRIVDSELTRVQADGENLRIGLRGRINELEAERDAALAVCHTRDVEIGSEKERRVAAQEALQAANQRADDAVAALPVIGNGYRIGQSLFNFLAWVQQQGYESNPDNQQRMVDPFYIEDERLLVLYGEYLNAIRAPKERADAI